MEKLRKPCLVLAAAAFAVCGLFLNLMGGIALIINNYIQCGVCLLVSVGLFLISLISAFFRKAAANIISLLTNIAASACYIYTLAVLNGVPNTKVPKESMEIITSRIYPSVIVTVLLAAVIFFDIFSYERISARAEKKRRKSIEKSRPLKDSEKII